MEENKVDREKMRICLSEAWVEWNGVCVCVAWCKPGLIDRETRGGVLKEMGRVQSLRKVRSGAGSIQRYLGWNLSPVGEWGALEREKRDRCARLTTKESTLVASAC